MTSARPSSKSIRKTGDCATAAKTYTGGKHFGFMVAGAFKQGNHRAAAASSTACSAIAPAPCNSCSKPFEQIAENDKAALV